MWRSPGGIILFLYSIVLGCAEGYEKRHTPQFDILCGGVFSHDNLLRFLYYSQPGRHKRFQGTSPAETHISVSATAATKYSEATEGRHHYDLTSETGGMYCLYPEAGVDLIFKHRRETAR